MALRAAAFSLRLDAGRLIVLLTGLGLDDIPLQCAAAFDVALSLRTQALSACALEVEGFESPLVNDLALGLGWKPRLVWKWPRPVHINILESSCLYRLLLSLARSSGPLRFVSLCDSAVSRLAVAKGRRPSRGLRRVLCRIAAVSLGFGLYPAVPFCPTRPRPCLGCLSTLRAIVSSCLSRASGR